MLCDILITYSDVTKTVNKVCFKRLDLVEQN